MRSFHDVLYSGIKLIFTNLFGIPSLDPEVFQQHVKTLEAIRKRDSDIAHIAIKEHISTMIDKRIELEF
jgi:DNA-binding FadR family transcriptional regulator